MRKEALCFPLSCLVLLSFSHFSLWFWVRRFGVSFPLPYFFDRFGREYPRELSSSTLWTDNADHSIGITRWELYLSRLSLNVSWGVFFSFVLFLVFFSKKIFFYGNFSVCFLILFTWLWVERDAPLLLLPSRFFLSQPFDSFFEGQLAIYGLLIISRFP